MIFTAEKALRDYGEQVPDDTRKMIEGKIADVRKALEGDRYGAHQEAPPTNSARRSSRSARPCTVSRWPDDGRHPARRLRPRGGEPTDEDVIEGDFTEFVKKKLEADSFQLSAIRKSYSWPALLRRARLFSAPPLPARPHPATSATLSIRMERGIRIAVFPALP